MLNVFAMLGGSMDSKRNHNNSSLPAPPANTAGDMMVAPPAAADGIEDANDNVKNKKYDWRSASAKFRECIRQGKDFDDKKEKDSDMLTCSCCNQPQSRASYHEHLLSCKHQHPKHVFDSSMMRARGNLELQMAQEEAANHAQYLKQQAKKQQHHAQHQMHIPLQVIGHAVPSSNAHSNHKRKRFLKHSNKTTKAGEYTVYTGTMDSARSNNSNAAQADNNNNNSNKKRMCVTAAASKHTHIPVSVAVAIAPSLNYNWRAKSRCFRVAVRAARQCFIAHRDEMAHLAFDIRDALNAAANASDHSTGCSDGDRVSRSSNNNNAHMRRWARTSRAMRRAVRALRKLRYVTHSSNFAVENADSNDNSVNEARQMRRVRSWRAESLQLRSAVQAARLHAETLRAKLSQESMREPNASDDDGTHLLPMDEKMNCFMCNEKFNNYFQYKGHLHGCYQAEKKRQRLNAMRNNSADGSYELVYVNANGEVCSEQAPDSNTTPTGTNNTMKRELHACGNCGRKFLAAPFQRHAAVCERVFNRKRSAFNSQQQRAQALMPESARSTAATVNSDHGGANTHWRAMSTALRAAMRAARDAQQKQQQLLLAAADKENDKENSENTNRKASPRSVTDKMHNNSNAIKKQMLKSNNTNSVGSETNNAAFAADLFECSLCGQRMGLAKYEAHSPVCPKTSKKLC
jgi:hypothetical protein